MIRRFWSSGPALMVVAMLIWASSIVVGRAAAGLIPPFAFAAGRWGGALLLALPFAVQHIRRDWPVVWANRGLMLTLGLSGITIYNALAYRGMHDTTAVNTLLLQSAVPMMVLVAVFVLFGERPRPVQAAAILLSFAGVVVIACQGSLAGLLHLHLNPGDVIVVVGLVAYALYTALLRLRPAVHALTLLTVSIAVADAVLVPMMLVEMHRGEYMQVTVASVAVLAYSAVLPGVVAYLLFNRAVDLVGGPRAGQFLHLIPVFGVLMAVAFLGERVHLFHLAGIVLIAAGLWLANRPRERGDG